MMDIARSKVYFDRNIVLASFEFDLICVMK